MICVHVRGVNGEGDTQQSGSATETETERVLWLFLFFFPHQKQFRINAKDHLKQHNSSTIFSKKKKGH